MHKIILLFLLLALSYSQQAEITNIQAAQRTDGSQIVDITYDLSEDAVFAVFTITVEVSLDGGLSFTGIENCTLLEEIYCFNNNLSSLDLSSAPILKKIYVGLFNKYFLLEQTKHAEAVAQEFLA